ncbi:MAG: 4Fe-4S binding protein [Bacteroidales bacterium]|nr:4Fe-4S binding protein [Bacteroidales bacterium]
MTYRLLKRIRVILSIVVFFLLTFVLVDFTVSLSTEAVKSLLYLQFVPSVIRFTGIVTLGSAGFLVVMILTLLFGRIYCAFLCPLGTLQDIISRMSRYFGKRRKVFRYRRPDRFIRYTVLGGVVILLALGHIILLELADPWSLFGRMVSGLLRPVVYGINNLAVHGLEAAGSYALYPVSMKGYSWLSAGVSAGMLALVGWLSFTRGREYCNTVCPVGTLLGFVSRISLFRIRLDETLCNSCGLCGASCKAGCIDTVSRKIDHSRCVMCLNCLTACKQKGIHLVSVTFHRRRSAPEYSLGRRGIIRNGMALAAGLFTLQGGQKSRGGGRRGERTPVKREHHATPPGSKGFEYFNDRCTACHLCVSACPTHVLQPSLLEYGLAGMMQPFMDYGASFCNFECTVCGEVCPTGAILPMTPEEKKQIQLGTARFIKDNCVVYTDGTACGACSEHCPTKAVQMVPYWGGLTIPKVTPEICVGCGACEFACPTTPKSIYVEGHTVHQQAREPEVEQVTRPDTGDDFPF